MTNQLNVAIRTGESGGVPSERLLDHGKYVFGGTAQADVIIPSLEPDRLFGIVIPEQSMGLQFGLMPFVDGVMSDGQALENGKFSNLRPPCVVTFQDVEISFLKPGSAPSSQVSAALKRNLNKNSPDNKGRVRLPHILIGASVVLVVASFLINPGDEKSVTVATQEPVSAPESSNISYVRSALIDNPSVLTQYLRERIAANDLAYAIDVSEKTDGVAMTGTLSAEQGARYRDILTLAKNRTSLIIANNVQLIREQNESEGHISAVILQPDKYIVGRDGSRYTIGDVMPDGWKIESIGAYGVIISKDGFEETIKF